MFRLKGIDHVALTVRDVERSVRWYMDVLGLERRYEKEWGNHPAVVGTGSTSLAIFPVRGEDPKTALGPEVLCFRHVAFRVDRENFERARKTLQGRGIQLDFQDHRASLSVYFRDPDGHQIEITTYEV